MTGHGVGSVLRNVHCHDFLDGSEPHWRQKIPASSPIMHSTMWIWQSLVQHTLCSTKLKLTTFTTSIFPMVPGCNLSTFMNKGFLKHILAVSSNQVFDSLLQTKHHKHRQIPNEKHEGSKLPSVAWNQVNALESKHKMPVQLEEMEPLFWNCCDQGNLLHNLERSRWNDGLLKASNRWGHHKHEDIADSTKETPKEAANHYEQPSRKSG